MAASEPFSESALFVVVTEVGRVDSDQDGIPDSYELEFGLDPFRNDAAEDQDGDGVSNLDEFNAGRNPLIPELSNPSQSASGVFAVSTQTVVADSDADGLPDTWEIQYGLNQFEADSQADPDGDGLTNLEEYNAGNNPGIADALSVSSSTSGLFPVNTATHTVLISADSDGDGMPDWWEQKYGLNPNINDANGDSDRDGIWNLDEHRRGQNPVFDESLDEVMALSGEFELRTIVPRLDSDNDGIPDDWELAHGLNQGANDAADDLDVDGLSNLAEYNAGTDPREKDFDRTSYALSELFLMDSGGTQISRTLEPVMNFGRGI